MDEAASTLSRHFRGLSMRSKHQQTLLAAIILQAHGRGVVARTRTRNHLKLKQAAATVIATRIRGAAARTELRRGKQAATTIEARVRSMAERKKYKSLRSAAIMIESTLRSRADLLTYEKQRESAVRLQCARRAHIARKRVARLRWHREQGNDLSHLEALELVQRLLDLNESPTSAPKVASECLADDFVDDFNLPGLGERTTHGIGAYLQEAMMRTPLHIICVDVKPWATRSATMGGSLHTFVEHDVRLSGNTRLRIEYTVRHAARGELRPLISRRSTFALETAKRLIPAASASAPSSNDTSRSARHSEERGVEHLRSCFAKLDGSGSGHLSIREIASATSLVGLRFDERELHQDLLTQDADGDGTFELHELDTVLRRNQRLQRSDLVSHTDQPFIFDVLPLAARTFDAHAAVNAALQGAQERENALTRDEKKGLAERGKLYTKSEHMASVKRLAPASLKRLDGRQRANHLPAPISEAQHALDESTADLAALVQQLEQLAAEGSAETEELEDLRAELDAACAALNQQRKRVAPVVAIAAERQRGAHERPRRPHALPPLATPTMSLAPSKSKPNALPGNKRAAGAASLKASASEPASLNLRRPKLAPSATAATVRRTAVAGRGTRKQP